MRIMETTIELKGYSQKTIENVKNSCGWGCGYVKIPLDHPFLVKRALNEDTYFYPQVSGFNEEITYCEIDDSFMVIGFDTMHSYNDSRHDIYYVSNMALELQKCIDSYTMEDAKKEAETYIEKVKSRFTNYLND